MSNVDYKVFENLTWNIDNKHLTISGGWSEEFEINPDTWTAASSLGGKDYSVCIYDKDGVFILEFSPDSENGDRLFYGLKPNGRYYFPDEKPTK